VATGSGTCTYVAPVLAGTASTLAGPATGTTYLGSRSDLADEHYYMGSMAGIMVQTNDIDDTEAYCAYQSGEKQLGVCDWDSDAVKVNVLGGRNMDGGTRGWGVDMGGEAHMEDDYGVTLDGMGDYLKVQGDDLDYAQTGSFGEFTSNLPLLVVSS
jgi:hypothetical protein